MPDRIRIDRRSGARDKSAAVPHSASRRAKGEQTRRGILSATIAVIAREGIRGVTHRAVAAEAAVPLSLTTYYFRDIEALIEQAFEQFCTRMRPDLQRLWSELFAYLENFSASRLRLVRTREEICDHLAARAADYIFYQVTRKPEGLAVEQIFFTEARLSRRLRALGAQHRQQLLQPFIRLCSRFDGQDPLADAELLLAVITTLEYQGVSRPKTAAEKQRIEALLRRQIGWTLGLKRR